MTSFMVARNSMQIRSFQNLMGRTARSGMYTEGSVIVTDPRLFDNRNNRINGGNLRWNDCTKMFDSSASEPCGSSILSLVQDIVIDYQAGFIGSEVAKFIIENYGKNDCFNQLISELSSALLERYPSKTNNNIAELVSFRKHTMEAIENHLCFVFSNDPTGGINAKNLNSYLAFDKVLACGGSWMVKKELISSGQFDKIRELTREAVQTMLGFSLKHIGINCADAREAEQTADSFARLFGFAKDPRDVSFFAGTAVEAMNTKGRGTMGHIAIGTNSVERAKNYLELLGCKFDETTCKYENGALSFIYLAEEIGGFAVHLTKN